MKTIFHIGCLCGHWQNEHHADDSDAPIDASFCGGCEEERPDFMLHRFTQAKTPELEHCQSKDCWCIPTVEQYEHADVVIHNDPYAKGGES